MSHLYSHLGAPPPLPDNGLRVIPLGGLGEVGRNMAVLEYRGRLLIIDCGVLFPDENQPGVDLILPDFSAIRDRLGDVEAVVLTHGHEDHIGAVPYLLRERPDIPLVGSKLTLALLDAKLREHRQTRSPRHQVKEGERLSFGPFDLEFVAVNHSIPDALAIVVRTGAGLLLHTGDFKMDQLPLDGPHHRPARLRPAGRGGRRPLPRRLDQRRGSGVHHLRARRSDRCSTGCSPPATSASSWPASPPTCTESSRRWTPPCRSAARSSTSAGRWSATWGSPATSAISTCPRTR